jgi:hypothetical protein
MQNYSSLRTNYLLIVLLLLGQGSLFFHQFTHDLFSADPPCEVCLSTSTLSHACPPSCPDIEVTRAGEAVGDIIGHSLLPRYLLTSTEPRAPPLS